MVYTKGWTLFPRDAKLLVKRGWVYQRLKQNEMAREDFAAAIRFQPHYAEAHTGLGYMQALAKSQSEALREASLALLHGTDDRLVRHNVACIYAEIAETEAERAEEYEDLALEQLRKAVEMYERD